MVLADSEKYGLLSCKKEPCQRRISLRRERRKPACLFHRRSKYPAHRAQIQKASRSRRHCSKQKKEKEERESQSVAQIRKPSDKTERKDIWGEKREADSTTGAIKKKEKARRDRVNQGTESPPPDLLDPSLCSEGTGNALHLSRGKEENPIKARKAHLYPKGKGHLHKRVMAAREKRCLNPRKIPVLFKKKLLCGKRRLRALQINRKAVRACTLKRSASRLHQFRIHQHCSIFEKEGKEDV